MAYTCQLGDEQLAHRQARVPDVAGRHEVLEFYPVRPGTRGSNTWAEIMRQPIYGNRFLINDLGI